MTRSFKDPYPRVPNFGIEGAIPKPPWWADIDHWRVVPPRSPPWSPPPSVPGNGTNPFGDPPRTPAPPQPNSESMQSPADADLMDRLFKKDGLARKGQAKQRRWPPQEDDARDWFVDTRPWHMIEALPDRLQHMPFYADQLDNLLSIPPKELKSTPRSGAAGGRAVQPPIFFPLD